MQLEGCSYLYVHLGRLMLQDVNNKSVQRPLAEAAGTKLQRVLLINTHKAKTLYFPSWLYRTIKSINFTFLFFMSGQISYRKRLGVYTFFADPGKPRGCSTNKR